MLDRTALCVCCWQDFDADILWATMCTSREATWLWYVIKIIYQTIPDATLFKMDGSIIPKSYIEYYETSWK